MDDCVGLRAELLLVFSCPPPTAPTGSRVGSVVDAAPKHARGVSVSFAAAAAKCVDSERARAVPCRLCPPPPHTAACVCACVCVRACVCLCVCRLRPQRSSMKVGAKDKKSEADTAYEMITENQIDFVDQRAASLGDATVTRRRYNQIDLVDQRAASLGDATVTRRRYNQIGFVDQRAASLGDAASSMGRCTTGCS